MDECKYPLRGFKPNEVVDWKCWYRHLCLLLQENDRAVRISKHNKTTIKALWCIFDFVSMLNIRYSINFYFDCRILQKERKMTILWCNEWNLKTKMSLKHIIITTVSNFCFLDTTDTSCSYATVPVRYWKYQQSCQIKSPKKHLFTVLVRWIRSSTLEY